MPRWDALITLTLTMAVEAPDEQAAREEIKRVVGEKLGLDEVSLQPRDAYVKLTEVPNDA
jgi:hypothetical protein